jgi:hypothetical protein
MNLTKTILLSKIPTYVEAKIILKKKIVMNNPSWKTWRSASKRNPLQGFTNPLWNSNPGHAFLRLHIPATTSPRFLQCVSLCTYIGRRAFRRKLFFPVAMSAANRPVCDQTTEI